LASGKGWSKKEAEQQASGNVLGLIEKIRNISNF